jgi:transposase
MGEHHDTKRLTGNSPCEEFIRFLNALEAVVPDGRIVHVILDNYATHKHPTVLAWLARHPRFVFHFTPTSCSWLNAVETFFAALTTRRLRRGAFHSIVDLQAASWASPCGVEGSVRNPSTPGGWYGRKADPKALYARV